MIIDCINLHTRKYYDDVTDVIHSTGTTISTFGDKFAICFKKEINRLSASDRFTEYRSSGWCSVIESDMIRNAYELSFTDSYRLVIRIIMDREKNKEVALLEGVVRYDGNKKEWIIR